MGGLRPSIPREVPKDLATLMQQCWDEDPKRRPSCTAILAALDGLIYALDYSGGFLSFIPRLLSRASTKIAPEPSMTDVTTHTEFSSDESTSAELSFNNENSCSSFGNNRNVSFSNCNNSSLSTIAQTTTTPRVNLSSLKKRKIRRKKLSRK